MYFSVLLTLLQMFARRLRIPDYRRDFEKYFQLPVEKRPGFIFMNSALASFIFVHVKASKSHHHFVGISQVAMTLVATAFGFVVTHLYQPVTLYTTELHTI